MRKTRMKVELEGRDDALEVTVDGRDIRRWELAERASFIETPLSYTALTQLAGYAAIRVGVWSGTHDEFMDLAVNVIQMPGDDEPRPTRKAAGDEPSSPSPSAPASRGKSGKKI